MVNIVYNDELNTALKKFYLHQISPLNVADIYYKYKLYSAANAYYTITIDSLLNKQDNYTKSYCFLQMANCYYYQQLDNKLGDWQVDTIFHLCKESVAHDYTNIKAHILLTKAYELMNQVKNAYYEAEFVINNLYLYDIESQEDFNVIVDFCIHFFDLCESHFVIKYDDVYKTIINYLSNNELCTYEMLQNVIERINNHKANVNQEEINTINGTAFDNL